MVRIKRKRKSKVQKLLNFILCCSSFNTAHEDLVDDGDDDCDVIVTRVYVAENAENIVKFHSMFSKETKIRKVADDLVFRRPEIWADPLQCGCNASEELQRTDCEKKIPEKDDKDFYWRRECQVAAEADKNIKAPEVVSIDRLVIDAENEDKQVTEVDEQFNEYDRYLLTASEDSEPFKHVFVSFSAENVLEHKLNDVLRASKSDIDLIAYVKKTLKEGPKTKKRYDNGCQPPLTNEDDRNDRWNDIVNAIGASPEAEFDLFADSEIMTSDFPDNHFVDEAGDFGE